MANLLTLPSTSVPPALNARVLYDQALLEETVAFCQQELPLVEKEIPAKSQKRPSAEAPTSPLYQYYALTAILTDTLAQLERWKAAKEVLGRYRVHFPQDPWGYTVGAEVTRRDPQVKDPEAVQEAIEMLESEAQRLEGKGKKKAS
ncbi:MAG: hypothetical protein WCF84_07595 [Anaerolineae bacterium]